MQREMLYRSGVERITEAVTKDARSVNSQARRRVKQRFVEFYKNPCLELPEHVFKVVIKDFKSVVILILCDISAFVHGQERRINAALKSAMKHTIINFYKFRFDKVHTFPKLWRSLETHAFTALSELFDLIENP